MFILEEEAEVVSVKVVVVVEVAVVLEDVDRYCLLLETSWWG
jgi:hypothetical protein